MNKFVAWLLAITLLAGLSTVALAQDTSQSASIPVSEFVNEEDPIGIQRGKSLTVGSTSMLSGHFGTDMWSHNTADYDVRALLHGYDTVAYTNELSVSMNGAVVKNVDTIVNSDGTWTFRINLVEGLTYSDGTPLTAQDYLFSMLLTSSPYIAQLGGTPASNAHLVGFEEYSSGQNSAYAGVRLLSQYAFSLQINSEFLPYFYGLAMLQVRPYPIAVIAPGCEVRDDGQGVYLAASANASSISANGYTPGDFSADMLRVTLLDPNTGYEFNPRVTTGPYSIESFDRNTHTGKFVINERFKGNYEGQRPHIERLEYTLVQNETMVEKLHAGEVDLLNKVMREDAVIKGQTLSVEQNAVQMANYPRSGLAFLAFACEEGPTASEAVRKAIATSLNIDEFVQQTAGSTGRRVYGYYGLGQWMLTYSNQETGLDSAQTQAEMEKLAVEYNVDKAIALLDADGWMLNESGRTFIQGVDAVRYRQGESGLEPLEINWAKMKDSQVADKLEQSLTTALTALGARLNITELTLEELLVYYYRQAPRTFNLFYLGTNFTYLFDPYYDFNTDEKYQGVANKTGILSVKLEELSLALRETKPSELDEYVTKWIELQKQVALEMPIVPLYSSIYFDFYINELQGYEIAKHPGWGHAIPYAWIQE